MECRVLWGDRVKKSGKDRVGDLVGMSSCSVTVGSKSGLLDIVEIVFSGAVAEVPSMKNSKLPGMNFVNPDYTARIKAMDVLFHSKTANLEQPLTFGNREVSLLVIHGDRVNSFDTDNATTTIKDWLEPSDKPVGKKKTKRGWGIGLVFNDKAVHPYSLHSRQIGNSLNRDTRIIIRPFEVIRQEAINFVGAHYL